MTIEAKIVCDSVSPNGIRLTTMELCYPRFIHAEFMTHRMFSRNASSSRAIPVKKVINEVMTNPAMLIHWGKNQAGMVAREECNNPVGLDWDYYNHYERIHKQIVNRLLEPFQHIKVIVTATEWENFFKLHIHKDAQPEMCLLATHMAEALDDSIPKKLTPGQWHLPYVPKSESIRLHTQGEDALQVAIKCSVARGARVSYMNHDNSSPDIDKDISLADVLLSNGHMSPFEHQATPMRPESFNVHAEDGITHIDKYDNLWSGNFRGFLQYRQLLG